MVRLRCPAAVKRLDSVVNVVTHYIDLVGRLRIAHLCYEPYMQPPFRHSLPFPVKAHRL